MRPQWPCPKIAGRAVTMKIKPAGLQQPTQHLGTAPIEAAQPGDIIVIDNGGKLEFSCWGGLLALSAKLKGLSGVVIDGASRDIDEARELGFPVYARGAVPMTARNRVVQESSIKKFSSPACSAVPAIWCSPTAAASSLFPRKKKKKWSLRRKRSTPKEQEMAAGIRKGYSGLEMLEKLGYEQMLNKK